MEIIFIGTGSGKASLNRFHTSFIIKTQNNSLLVDTGDSVSRALLKSNISFNSITHILITHTHADHFSGLASLITQMKMSGRKEELKIVVNSSLVEVIKNYLKYNCIFNERLVFDLIYAPIENFTELTVDDQLSLMIAQNSHLDKYLPYNEDGAVPLSSSSILFNSRDYKIQYTGDMGNSTDLNVFNTQQIDILISETTHVSPKELVEYVKTVNPKMVLLTHIDDESFCMSFQNEIKGVDKLTTAYDGLKIEIPIAL